LKLLAKTSLLQLQEKELQNAELKTNIESL